MSEIKNNTLKIVIADDHPIFRAGVKNILESHEDFAIIAEAGDGKSALKLINEMKPDVAVLDIEMPELSGLKVASLLNSENGETKIVLLTMYDDRKIFLEALDYGVKGYVLKDETTNNIITAVNTVAEGRYYLCPELSGLLIDSRKPKKENTHLSSLSKTEKNILRLVADLKSNDEIAEILFISKRTVENHRVNIAGKLELGGAKHLLKFAVKNKSLLR